LAEAQWSKTMKNMMEINGYRALIQFDPDIDMFRGEFDGKSLNQWIADTLRHSVAD
jgi:predicted HicB family RNase H-like nuclease